MADFVYDVITLNGSKVDRAPIPVGEDPNKWLDVSDWNPAISALNDIRDAIINNRFLGLQRLGVQPNVPTGGAPDFMWMTSAGVPTFHIGGTNYNFMLTPALTAGVLPVATAADTIGNSSFLATGPTLDITATAGGIMTLGNTNSSQILIGSQTVNPYVQIGGNDSFIALGDLSGTGTGIGGLVARMSFNLNAINDATAIATKQDAPLLFFGPVYWDGATQQLDPWAVTVKMDSASPVQSSMRISLNNITDLLVLRRTAALEFNNGSAAAVSAAGFGAIRYNNTTHVFEQSLNGGAWGPLSGAGPSNGVLGAYQAATSTAQNIIGLTSTLGPVLIRDNATPIAGPLFGVQNSAGTTKYFDVTATSTIAFKNGMADNPGNPPAFSFDTVANFINALTLFEVRRGGTLMLSLDRIGDLTIASSLTIGTSSIVDVTSGSLGLGSQTANAITIGNLANTSTTTINTVNTLISQKASDGLLNPTGIALKIAGAANVNVASTEAPDLWVHGARTVTWKVGALATQRFNLFEAPTIAFQSASTAANVATVAITGAPVAGALATLTNRYALWVQADLARFDGGIQFSDGTTQTTASAGTIAGLTTTHIPVAASSTSISDTPMIYASSLLSLPVNALGVANTLGLSLQNNTLASAGTNQYSPALEFLAQTWTGSISQSTEWNIQLRGVTGNTNSDLVFRRTYNGAGSADIAAIADVGGGLGALYFGPVSSGDYIFGGNNTLTMRVGGTARFAIATAITTGTYVDTAGRLNVPAGVAANSVASVAIGSAPGSYPLVIGGSSTGNIQFMDAGGAPSQIQATSLGNGALSLTFFAANTRGFIFTGDATAGVGNQIMQVKGFASSTTSVLRVQLGPTPNFAATVMDVLDSAGTTTLLTIDQSGGVNTDQGFDSLTATTLFVGAHNATAITLGQTSAGVDITAETPHFKILQGASFTPTGPGFDFVGGTLNATASTEYVDFSVSVGSLRWTGVSTVATERVSLFNQPTLTSTGGTTTFTIAATLAIAGPPIAGTSAVITSAVTLWTQDGRVLFEVPNVGNAINKFGLTVQNPTASTAVAPTAQWSPWFELTGSAWNTTSSTSNAIKMGMQLATTSGTSTAVIGQINYGYSIGGSPYTTIATLDGNGDMLVSGGMQSQGYLAGGQRSAASTVTVTASDFIVGVTGSGARTVNLPAVSACKRGQYFIIQDVGNSAGTITINRAGTDTINGGTSVTISVAYGSLLIWNDGSSAWYAH